MLNEWFVTFHYFCLFVFDIFDVFFAIFVVFFRDFSRRFFGRPLRKFILKESFSISEIQTFEMCNMKIINSMRNRGAF